MVTFTLAKSVPKAATATDIPLTVEDLMAFPADQRAHLGMAGFEGKVGQTFVGGVDGTVTEVLVGLGPEEQITSSTLRLAAAAFIRSVSKHKTVACTMLDGDLPFDVSDAVSPIVEGLALPTYTFDTYKSKKDAGVSKVVLVGSGAGLRAALGQAVAIVDAVHLARDFGNEPGGTLTPEEFAQRAQKAAVGAGLTVAVWTEKKIEREKLGGLMAVNQGSERPPRFLKVSYKPKGKAVGNVALVGKGITFDSGGLSIKTSTGMMTMKIDMAGGAAVLATMLALPAVKAKVAVTAYIPLTDNMTGGDAQRPGDVFTARNGKTVEVLNTDAEGRLVLADALSLAAEAKPDAIIDIATLTGSSTMALGKGYAALMANDDALSNRIESASAGVGEKVWRLPLPEEYKKKLDSNVADLRNIGTDNFGGAIIAGLFLEQFTGQVPWAHIDLGMAALTDSDSKLNPKGATGFGVRLLVETLSAWE